MTSPDTARVVDGANIAAGMRGGDFAHWSPVITVDKYDDDQTEWVAGHTGLLYPTGADFELMGVKPYEVVEAEGNLLTTAGLQRLTNLLIGAGGVAVTLTTARIGVGNSSTAAAVGQTDLQAASGSGNRQFEIMDATYPTAVNGLVTLRSTFSTGEANFAWAEWCVDVATATVAAGTTINTLMLNRAVQALGTKASGSWVLTATITIS